MPRVELFQKTLTKHPYVAKVNCKRAGNPHSDYSIRYTEEFEPTFLDGFDLESIPSQGEYFKYAGQDYEIEKIVHRGNNKTQIYIDRIIELEVNKEEYLTVEVMLMTLLQKQMEEKIKIKDSELVSLHRQLISLQFEYEKKERLVSFLSKKYSEQKCLESDLESRKRILKESMTKHAKIQQSKWYRFGRKLGFIKEK